MENIALVIEDDQDLSSIFTDALKAAGYRVETIRDGAVAQQRLKETNPEIVILDMHLPNVEGGKLLEQIRADERLVKTRVILATADALLGEYYEKKADLVLVKPISFSQLRDLTARYRKK
ncbi:Polar-differentiation response regulator DivK [Anaerolineales bacterium]|nr:Polar-differentiation response regulator DivK [Anaerolineales bacterium]